LTGPDDTSWSTQQLTELLALVSALPADADVAQRAVEHAAEALEAEVGALLRSGQVVATVGYAHDAVPVDELVRASNGHVQTLDVPGVGPCQVFTADCDALPEGKLLLARSGTAAPSGEDRSLLRGLARVLSLALQARSTVEDERRRRTDSEREVRRSERLVTSLRERQALLERLSRLQRSISTRRPLHEVLDNIVVGAAELIGDECAALRLLSPDDPGFMQIAASTGISPDVVARARRTPVDHGIGGRAVLERRLVATDNYPGSDHPIQAFLRGSTTAAMAAPVYQGAEVTGSLTVSTSQPGRSYSEGEKEVLLAFAEHASLALNDARTVEALRQAVSHATREAQHDGLTGLPNRSHFLELLQDALDSGRSVGLLFIDLDDFKIVNDTLGHPVGDDLLRFVAERVRGSLRPGDVVARLGGDEFAVLLADTAPRHTVSTAERIRATLTRPFRLPGHQVSVGASTGVVLWPSGQPASSEDLLRDADVAMYRAKAAGKGHAVVFQPRMRHDLQQRSQLERDLREALDSGQLVTHYQPIIDVSEGRVVGAEALLRWEHPLRGPVSPAEFIPVAEETGMVLEIGRQVLLDACRQAVAWSTDPRARSLNVSVNVSARQLAEPTFFDDVRCVLEFTGLAPTRLTLELTETVLVRDVDDAAATLQALTDLGVRIAIDDFGTAYSSLSYLAALPVTILKIDKSFVQGSATRIAAGIVALADGLGLDTVVEGVESLEELQAMTALGCRMFQGFLWAPAVTGNELPAVAESLRHSLLATDVPAPRDPSSSATRNVRGTRAAPRR
jgi:diguanylate cyclase (GGDEF)-like protein